MSGSVPQHCWRWEEDAAEFRPATESAEIQVVDSWLVDAGRVRGLERHVERFSASCAARGRSVERTTRFLRAAVALLPVTGRWFPRVELAHDGRESRYRLLLRSAPERGGRIRVRITDGFDRRMQPRVKGVDLEYLAGLRAAAIAAGGDEAVLLSPSGHVLEGSTTSVVWWRGRTLCGPPPGAVLPSVTRAVLAEAVAAAGHPVVHEEATPADLADVAVWTLNALPGIRPVTAGLGRPAAGGLAGRWQRRLDALAVAVGPRSIAEPDYAQEAIP